MRERMAMIIMVGVLIFLFAFTFAILGKGEYEPTPEEPVASPVQGGQGGIVVLVPLSGS
jgi:hypothetical protein